MFRKTKLLKFDFVLNGFSNFYMYISEGYCQKVQATVVEQLFNRHSKSLLFQYSISYKIACALRRLRSACASVQSDQVFPGYLKKF